MKSYTIQFEGSVRSEDSDNMEILASSLQNDYGFMIERLTQVSPPGTKDASIITSIIASAIGGIGGLISALAYWQSKRPKYQITLTFDNKTILIETADRTNLGSLIRSIELEFGTSEPEVIISRRDDGKAN